MPNESRSPLAIENMARLRAGLTTLLEAADYAADTQSARWDFAVSIQELRRLGFNDSDLRWLIRKGFVEHAREITVLGQELREFRPTGKLSFVRRTCCILTELGTATVRSIDAVRSIDCDVPKPTALNGSAHAAIKVAVPAIRWDAELRKLHVNGVVVKRFKWPAANQESVLNAFEEEGWPARIDDPLAPQPDQDAKRRLSDTIKCLNRKHEFSLIHFRGDGTGEGVFWEFIDRRPESSLAAGNGAPH